MNVHSCKLLKYALENTRNNHLNLSFLCDITTEHALNEKQLEN